MVDEVNNEAPQPVEPVPVVPEHVSKLRAVVKDMEDSLETLEAIPEHVRLWIKAKVEALKAHL